MTVCAFGQDESTNADLPNIDQLFQNSDEGIDASERPKNLQLQLPETLQQVPIAATSDERQELSTWVRWLVLKNLPPSYEDNRKWGKHKEVFDGIQLRREGWKVETKRKKKLVKQGTWSRYYVEFMDPAKTLDIVIERMEYPKNDLIRIQTRIIAPLKLFGRVSQWQRDVQLISISANAMATVEMHVQCDVQVIVNPLKFPPDVEFRPVVTDASIQLREFDVERISQMHGPMADLLGKGIRETLDNKLEDYRDKLVLKMNQEIKKQQSKFVISVQDWVATSIYKKTN